VRIAVCIASNNRWIANDKLESFGVKEFRTQFEAVSQHLAGAANNHETQQSEYLI
jgi:hypothetical protein